MATSILGHNEEDFTTFRQKKLKLPVRQRPVNPVVMDEKMLSSVSGTAWQPCSGLPYNMRANLFSDSGQGQLCCPLAVTNNYLTNEGNILCYPFMLSNKMTVSETISDTVIKIFPVTISPPDAENIALTDKKLYVVSSQKSLQEYRQIKNRSYDLDQDDMVEYYSLQDGKLKVTTGSETIWQSPDEWWVDYFLPGDANNDNIPDISLLVWKEGSFGPHKPFWITSEDKSIKNHLFIFKLKNGSLKPVWQSSNLDRPILELAISDLDNDGKNELVTIEGNYASYEERQATIWQWNGWGFSMISN